MRRPFRRGFTLIELLTVIAIIGILAAVLIPAAMGVMKRSKQATSRATFTGWASGLIRYKQAYGFFPNIAAGATYPTADTAYKFESAAATAGNFVMALSGRQPSGTALTGGTSGYRMKFNRNAETFVEFSVQDYEKPSALSAASAGTIGTGNYLIDRFGNRSVRVVIDFNGDGVIKSATGAPIASAVPTDIAGYRGTAGYQARVIIYTSSTDVTSADYTTQPAAGTPQSDFLDVIAAQ